MATLLVCSVGGHLSQLHRLLGTLEGLDPERVWVTFDTPQSRSLLGAEQVRFLDYTGPRDIRNVLRHTATARRMLAGEHRFTNVVSTGSGIALSFLPLASVRGVRCHYIESFTRSAGPSRTGALLARLPRIEMYTQFPALADHRWRYEGSVFDAFCARDAQGPERAIERAVVTLGTMKDYAFPRLLRQVHKLLPAEAQTLWQVGCTDAPDLAIEGRRSLPAEELQGAIRRADVVIAHAGCGSAIAALQAGKLPVLIARRATHGENVDDHQVQLAQELERRGLAIVRSVETLTREDLQLAARGSVDVNRQARPFRLAGTERG